MIEWGSTFGVVVDVLYNERREHERWRGSWTWFSQSRTCRSCVMWCGRSQGVVGKESRGAVWRLDDCT